MATLKQFRARCGWSQSQLAEFLGVSLNTIQRWEGGWHMPPVAVIRLLTLIEQTGQWPTQSVST